MTASVQSTKVLYLEVGINIIIYKLTDTDFTNACIRESHPDDFLIFLEL